MKRRLFVIERREGEDWRGVASDADIRKLRADIRREVGTRPVPVVAVPPGLNLWTVELENETEAGESQ